MYLTTGVITSMTVHDDISILPLHEGSETSGDLCFRSFLCLVHASLGAHMPPFDGLDLNTDAFLFFCLNPIAAHGGKLGMPCWFYIYLREQRACL